MDLRCPLRAVSLAAALLLCACSDDDQTGKAVNHPCDTNSDCADGVCHSGICASPTPKANGQSCKGGGECKSFRCVGYKCVAGEKTAPDVCINHEECLSGVCSSGTCKGGPRPDAGPDAPPPDLGQPDSRRDIGKPDLPALDLPALDLLAPDLLAPDLPGPDASLCGNGKLDPGEQCDKTVPAVFKCKDLGFDEGTLSCRTDCTLSTQGCYEVKDKGGFNVTTTGYGIYARVATDGKDFLVAWKTVGKKVYAARVSAAGGVLDAKPIYLGITASSGYETHPAVGFGGGNYLVAWDGGGVPGVLRATRVSTKGVVLDPLGITVTANPGSKPDIAFDGTNFMVVWNHKVSYSDRIFAARISSAGAVLDKSPVQVNQSTATGYQFKDPAVAFDGTNYLVAFVAYKGGSNQDIWANRLTTSAAVLDKTDITVATAIQEQWLPDVAFGKTNYLVVWEDLRMGKAKTFIGGARVTKAGKLLDPNGLLMSTCPTVLSMSPAVDHDGTHFFVTWHGCVSSNVDNVMARRVDAQGNGVGLTFDASGGTPKANMREPALSHASGQFLVLWKDIRNTPNDPRIYGSRIRLGKP